MPHALTTVDVSCHSQRIDVRQWIGVVVQVTTVNEELRERVRERYAAAAVAAGSGAACGCGQPAGDQGGGPPAGSAAAACCGAAEAGPGGPAPDRDVDGSFG